MKFSIKDFFSKCDQIRRKLRIWSYLLKKCLMENFFFCAVLVLKFMNTKHAHKTICPHQTLLKDFLRNSKSEILV